jgi:hypothetical protein
MRTIILVVLLVAMGLGALAWARLQLARQEDRREELGARLRESPTWRTAVEAADPVVDDMDSP